jgi:hypothetical protein
VFGDGRRVPLDRNARARFVWLVKQDRRHGRLSATGEDVALVLVAMLGEDGRLDPSHETIRERVGCRALSTVAECLKRLRDLGRITWERRLRRDAATGWRAAQTSNAYVLLACACDTDPAPGVKFVSLRKRWSGAKLADQQPQTVVTAEERTAAQAALAARRQQIEARLAADRAGRLAGRVA